MTSSPKERVQLTFCPVADPNHPQIEINCEPGHPFLVDKKGKIIFFITTLVPYFKVTSAVSQVFRKTVKKDIGQN